MKLKSKYLSVTKFIVMRLTLVAMILPILGTLSSCYFFPKEEEALAPPIQYPEEITYDTVEVKHGTIERSIISTGIFISVNQQDVFFSEWGGRVKDVYVKPGDTVEKGQLLVELGTGDLEYDIKLQEINLRKSKIVYERVKSQAKQNEEGIQYDLELAQLDVEVNKMQSDKLKAELDSSKLFSPIDGEILYISDISSGDYVDTFETIARVSDPNKLQLTYTGEAADEYRVGMEVEVNIDNNICKGVVVAAPSDIPRDADASAMDTILFKLDPIPQGVVLGTRADIKLILEKKDNIIVLGRSLVKSFSDRKFVNVLSNGVREERDVEIGIQTTTEVEIIKGLEAGEKVIIN